MRLISRLFAMVGLLSLCGACTTLYEVSPAPQAPRAHEVEREPLRADVVHVVQEKQHYIVVDHAPLQDEKRESLKMEELRIEQARLQQQKEYDELQARKKAAALEWQEKEKVPAAAWKQEPEAVKVIDEPKEVGIEKSAAAAFDEATAEPDDDASKKKKLLSEEEEAVAKQKHDAGAKELD